MENDGSGEMTTISRPRKYSRGKPNTMQHMFLVGKKEEKSINEGFWEKKKFADHWSTKSTYRAAT